MKLKSNVIGRKIRTKTRFLTQDNAQIDPIFGRIKGYSYREFEDDCWHSIINFYLFSRRNLTFKNSMDAEIDLEVIESKRFKNCDV